MAVAEAVAQQGVTIWSIDPVHSHVEFAVRHLMISTVKGRFTDVSGVVTSHDDPEEMKDQQVGLA